MNTDQAGKLIAIVSAHYPHSKPMQGVVDVWLHALGDLPFDECQSATLDLLLVAPPDARWLPPSTIRRHVLATRGLLAPDVDQAWRNVQRFVDGQWPRSPNGTLLSQPELETIGSFSADALLDGGTTMYAQFRDTYALAKRRHDERVMLRRHDVPAIESTHTKELPG